MFQKGVKLKYKAQFIIFKKMYATYDMNFQVE